MSSLIREVDLILPRAATAFGGKAANLAALSRAGFPVPLGYAVSAEAAAEHYGRALSPQLQPHRLLAGFGTSEDQLAEARQRVLAVDVSDAVVKAVASAMASLDPAAATGIAVRASRLAEGGHTGSSPSGAATRLSVVGLEAVVDAVRACWASLFVASAAVGSRSPRSAGGVGMGVVLQVMVPAEAAGALFTENPSTADSEEMVVNASYGLGTVMNDTAVTPDTYRIVKESGWVRDRVVGDKPVRDDGTSQGGLVRSPVPQRDRGRMCFDEHVLGQLIDLGGRIERHFGCPCDIDWSVYRDQVFVLESRPLVAARSEAPPKPPRKARSLPPDPVDMVWSNRYVGEFMPGVATPLTWSILSSYAETALQGAMRMVGCRVPKHVRFVGNFRGRIYINFSELSRVATQVPGLGPLALLPDGGRVELDRMQRTVERHGSAGFVARLPATAIRLAREHWGVTRRVARFEEWFAAEVARLRALDLRILPGAALDATLSDVHRLLVETGTQLLAVHASFLAGLYPLRRVLRGAFEDGATALEHDLLSVVDTPDGCQLASELLAVAAVAAHDPAAREVILRSRVEGSSARHAPLPAGTTREAIQTFVECCGYQAARDAELMKPRFRERPELLFGVLRPHLRAAVALHPRARARARLARAEERLGQARLPVRAATRTLLRVSRSHLALRERLRGRVTEVLDLARQVALDADRRLSVRQPGCGPGAAFFLTLPELHAVLRGERFDVTASVTRRRSQHQRDCALPQPPETFVGYPRTVPSPASWGGRLQGVGASGGRAEGRVCVLRDPSVVDAFEAGDVLVVPYGELGWTPLFLAASALVTDFGGPLSHACVAAREYGLPVVVNCRFATRVLRTGDMVCVDGDTGEVRG